MSDFDADVSELNQLVADMRGADGRIGRKAAAAVRKTARDIEATSKQFAPVDTGALRNSIGHDITGDGRFGAIEATVGPTVEYGAHVEYGTSRNAPAAYMGPALDRHGPDLIRAIGSIAGDI